MVSWDNLFNIGHHISLILNSFSKTFQNSIFWTRNNWSNFLIQHPQLGTGHAAMTFLKKVKKNQALYFGIILSALSVSIIYFSANLISAILLASTIAFYFFVYTIWLKRKTPQNIVIGGAAGAFPPVIGWTIATGSLSVEPLAFFLIIFFWTPSHFWGFEFI